MNWGDELCGVRVTPEAWYRPAINDNGIVSDMLDGWWGLSKVWGKWLQDNGKYRPIFPPRGWAGKTDVELFADRADEDGRIWFSSIAYSFWIEADGLIRFSPHSPIATVLHDPAALRRALQNAEILARRLRSGT